MAFSFLCMFVRSFSVIGTGPQHKPLQPWHGNVFTKAQPFNLFFAFFVKNIMKGLFWFVNKKYFMIPQIYNFVNVHLV